MSRSWTQHQRKPGRVRNPEAASLQAGQFRPQTVRMRKPDLLQELADQSYQEWLDDQLNHKDVE